MSAICFENFYTATTTQDCIIGPPPSATGFPDNSIAPADPDDVDLFNEKLPTIQQIPVCYSSLDIDYMNTVSET